MLTVDSGTSSGICDTYDALGRMVEKATGTSCATTYTEIVYAPWGSRLATMNGQTLQQASVPLVGGAEAVYNSSGLLAYRHPDHLGSSRFASTPSRTKYFDVAYAPYGEDYADSGTTDLSFTGQKKDTASWLYDFTYRKYNPAHGRWMSPDPAGMGAVNPGAPQTWNGYAYVANGPINAVDPLGLLQTVTICPAAIGDCNFGGDPGYPSAYTIDGVEVSAATAQTALRSGGAVVCPQCQRGQIVDALNVILDYRIDFYLKNCSGPVSGGLAGAMGNCTTTFLGTGYFPSGSLPDSFKVPVGPPNVPGNNASPDRTLDDRANALAHAIKKTGVQTITNPCTIGGFYVLSGLVGGASALGPEAISYVSGNYPSLIQSTLEWLSRPFKPQPTMLTVVWLAAKRAGPPIYSFCSSNGGW
jgi:RHS repeat-associated protein